ncbi:hypothetical protein [Streptomyces sp. NRRL F-2664]|uniref:hypothetical protein n=1 Tax=Streptomyces sp. NRRL F-2664 TaxID=1463842 RepID=UPI00131DD8BD|nr:hypothetical protein [Streptomyces sp. NRRL F-2664]
MNHKTVVSALATLTLLSTASVAEASGTVPTSRYCHYNGTLSCAADFRGLVKIATFGKVLDAPQTPPIGQAALEALRNRMEQSNPYLSSMHFSNPDWSGNVLSIAVNGCQGTTPRPITMNLHHIDSSFDNAVNSEIGMNQCQVSPAADPDRTGYVGNARPIGWHNPGTALHNQITSISYYPTPTKSEAVKACVAKTAKCTLNQVTTSSIVQGDAQAVAYSTNCTSTLQNRALWWETSVANETSFTTEYGQKLSIGLEFGDLKTGIEASFLQRYGHSTTNTTTFKQQDMVSIPAKTRSTLYKTPVFQALSGTATAQMNDGGAVVSLPWTVNQAVADGSEGLVWDEVPLTAAELRDPAVCPLSGGVASSL